MTTKNNYRAALEEIEDLIDHTGFPFEGSICGHEGEMILSSETVETIRRALLIAERVESEPSEAMLSKGQNPYLITDKPSFIDRHDVEFCFSAMRDQLLSEVDAELDGAK